MSIFLEPNEENLRYVITILSDFYKISCLKINVTKTHAVWFGNMHDSNIKLCPDLELEWTKEFTLLGIWFDNNLRYMDNNFKIKLTEIKKLLGAWFNRFLTPYGKITVIKSLALSKLSHIALVVPSLSKQRIKEIEKIMYDFLWANNPDKVCREDAKIPIKNGGLGMIDVLKFWQAF